LAKKLKDCGVFGVTSDEFYNYATANRQEWQIKGQQVVAEYVEKHCRGNSNNNSISSIINKDKSPAAMETTAVTTTTTPSTVETAAMETSAVTTTTTPSTVENEQRSTLIDV
jgi:hypothetical protein